MGRPGTSINARIAKLEAASERAKKIPRGSVLASRPMCEVLGVSWPTLREWCNEFHELEASGAVVRGGNGIEWEFKPAPTVRIILKAMKSQRDGQARKSREISRAIGVSLSPDEAAPSLAETKDLVNLTLAVVAAQEKQGRYTPTEQMLDFIDRYNRRVVEGIMGVRTRMDPNGKLPPQVRAEIDKHLRAVATEVHGEAERFIEENRAGTIQAGAI
ncbi:hypothetical protein [Novosphingobium sp.]|uniref:hypothetical protein n=1 Tax=Novosphingobium sp. TaxID=1874826 RepID=UPI002FDEFF81